LPFAPARAIICCMTQQNRARPNRDYFSGFGGRPQPQTRACDHPGCSGEGAYRAPKDRTHLTEYHWFCLEHVQAYNRSWDYCAGLSETEIEEEIRRDTTWQRPSWPLGKWGIMERRLREKIVRGKGFSFGADADEADDAGGRRGGAGGETPETQALALLGLASPIAFDQIKARYRELAKVLHPDANGGDKEAEERLKCVNQAYTVLKAWYGA
jgi:hypothetical protein